jgi:hypothetical protein
MTYLNLDRAPSPPPMGPVFKRARVETPVQGASMLLHAAKVVDQASTLAEAIAEHEQMTSMVYHRSSVEASSSKKKVTKTGKVSRTKTKKPPIRASGLSVSAMMAVKARRASKAKAAEMLEKNETVQATKEDIAKPSPAKRAKIEKAPKAVVTKNTEATSTKKTSVKTKKDVKKTTTTTKAKKPTKSKQVDNKTKSKKAKTTTATTTATKPKRKEKPVTTEVVNHENATVSEQTMPEQTAEAAPVGKATRAAAKKAKSAIAAQRPSTTDDQPAQPAGYTREALAELVAQVNVEAVKKLSREDKMRILRDALLPSRDPTDTAILIAEGALPAGRISELILQREDLDLTRMPMHFFCKELKRGELSTFGREELMLSMLATE